jgi:hypothetical protein
LPNPRQLGRQKTCGRDECKKENHRRQCRHWNRKNPQYFKANYLSAKLCRTKDPPEAERKCAAVMAQSRIQLGLPIDIIIAITGKPHLVILEYIVEQILRRRAVKAALHPG